MNQELTSVSKSLAPHGGVRTEAGRWAAGLKFAFAAFVAGARSIPLGDNGALFRELAARRWPAELTPKPKDR